MYADLGQVRQRVEAFEDCSIAPAAFDHRSHLTVACWYAQTEDDPLERMRRGIHRFNAHHGIFTSPTRGYHETITRFWMTMVRASLCPLPDSHDATARINKVVAVLSDKMLILDYYSRDLIVSDDARYGWMKPDKKPLPEVRRRPRTVAVPSAAQLRRERAQTPSQ